MSRVDTRGAVALAVAALALREAVRIGVFDLFVDDAYIFLRYAGNLAGGEGLRYNAHDSVMGFSSPAYTLLLGGVAKVVGTASLETAVTVLNAVLFLVATALVVSLLPRHRGAWLLLIGWLFYAPFVDSTLTGMETTLFLCLQLATVALLAGDRRDAAVVVAVLAGLTRPEGWLFAAAVGAYLLLVASPRRIPWRGAAVGTAVVLAWVVFAVAAYGTIVPHSVVAKSGLSQDGLAQVTTNPLDKLVLLAAGLSSGQYAGLPAGARVVLVILVLGLAALAVPATRQVIRERSPAVLFPAWFLATWAFYVVGRPVLIWSWYAVPTAFAFWWVAADAAGRAIRRIGVSWTRRARVDIAALAAIASICLVSLVFGTARRADSLGASTEQLDAVADFVVARYPSARSVMLGDIGVVGWRTGLRVIDLAGLVSEEPLDRDADGRLVSLATLLRGEEPDLLVLAQDPRDHDTAQDGSIVRRTFPAAGDEAWFDANYELAGQPVRTRFVFARRDLTAVTPVPASVRTATSGTLSRHPAARRRG